VLRIYGNLSGNELVIQTEKEKGKNMSYGIKQRNTFGEVLANCDDQVTVRLLLRELVPEKIKQRVIEEFNNRATDYNRRVVKMIGEDELREGCHV
jgi:DNA phosphorothioation-dependent restriction protein DptG